MRAKIEQSIQESIRLKERILHDEAWLARMEDAVALMVSALRDGGRIHFCGNGGSAADAQHLAAELSGRFRLDRPPLNAEALTCNSSYLTAVSNDYGYDSIFERLLKGVGRAGDLLVAISTSGNSQNILRVCEAAQQMGIKVIALTGESGGKMRMCADILLNVPSQDTPRIQEAHIMVGHILCEMVEQILFV